MGYTTRKEAFTMTEALKGRRVIIVSMPIEALLEIAVGRAAIKLPSDIPSDAQYAYAYIDEEHELIKIAITHPSFELRPYGDYIRTVKAEVVPATPDKNEDANKGYSGNSIVNNEDWARLV